MNAAELRDVIRQDYLDDGRGEFLWPDAELLRSMTEAERQACSRTDFIYDDSTAAITQLKLVDGQSSYRFHHKITVLERILWNGMYIEKVTKEMMDRKNPSWRTDTGLTGKTIYAIVQGRNIRITPTPLAADILIAPTVNLEVYRLPKDTITNFDQCFEIPNEFVPDLKFWVLHEALKKRDADTYNSENGDENLRRFERVFGPVVPSLVRQHQFEAPRSMMIVPKVSIGGSRPRTIEDW